MRSFGWVLLATWWAACGNPALDDYDQFIAARDRIYCEAALRCCTPAELQMKSPQFFDLPSCLRAKPTQPLQPPGSSTTRQAIAAGTIHFDRTEADRCLDQLRNTASSCDNPTALSALLALTCRRAYGARPAGATCTSSGECADDGICDRPTHVCRATAKAGQSCGAAAPYCDSYSGLICLSSGVCGPALADGQVCSGDGLDTSCQGLGCRSGVCGPFTTVGGYVCGNITISPSL